MMRHNIYLTANQFIKFLWLDGRIQAAVKFKKKRSSYMLFSRMYFEELQLQSVKNEFQS